MQELAFTLTIEETNLVLEGLGNLPFAKVYPLVSKIQAQAAEQIKARGADGNPPAAPEGEGKPAN